MFTWFPSATAFALALGAGSPCADRPGAGTLGLPAGGVLALLSLLMSAFALPMPPPALAGPASPAYGTLRYHGAQLALPAVRGFGARLEPRYIFAAGQLLDQ